MDNVFFVHPTCFFDVSAYCFSVEVLKDLLDWDVSSLEYLLSDVGVRWAV